APARARRRQSPLRAALGWLWSPRPVAFRPAYALAFGAVLALAATQVDISPEPSVVTRVVEAPAVTVMVQFRLRAPEANTVSVAGTFTGWRPTVQLEETAPGEWTALVPLVPGVHDYAFVIDGERWVNDPHAPQVDDDFGGTNNRISLPPQTAT
ncbi:MAG TPA: glycogen-binding domain-containing protein, partial [Longimicrobium sp.]|nr:glycogen-binding domain-containing protein [Longimicrobium sp.]